MVVIWPLEELTVMFIFGMFVPESMSRPFQVTGTQFLVYVSDTELQNSILVHLIEL
jgi:hypothetical protein